jgi:glycosyl transferase, family 25
MDQAKKMMDLQILIISLESSKERREKVRLQMSAFPLNWQFLDAVDGRKSDPSPLQYKPQKVKKLLGFELTKSEIGCYLSHIKCWQFCIEKNVTTLILEDDFVLEESFIKVIARVQEIKLNWHILRLQGLISTDHFLIGDIDKMSLCVNYKDPLGTAAYIIKPIAAKKLIESSIEIYEPVDHFIEHYEKHGIKILAIKPYPITTLDSTLVETTITDRTTRLPIKGLKKIMRSYRRLLDRILSSNAYYPKLRNGVTDNFLQKYFQS